MEVDEHVVYLPAMQMTNVQVFIAVTEISLNSCHTAFVELQKVFIVASGSGDYH